MALPEFKNGELMGLYVWHEPQATEIVADELIDIIAIQGLHANPYYTWVKKVQEQSESGEQKEVMWLRDLLPAEVKNTRIMTFSYLSKGVKISLRELGEQLLTSLHQDRKNINASRRPIIFIAHSMGGLVLKQALVLASNRPNCDDIKRATAGIVFLGTPHGGTDLAGYGAFIATVQGHDKSLIESLQTESPDLYNLGLDFAAGYGDLQAKYFYEKISNEYLGGILKKTVVEARSAVREGKDMMYLLTDHSGLNKFSGPEDPNFKLVIAVLKGLCQDSAGVVRERYRDGRQRESSLMIPFERDEDFIGREDIIHKIYQCLASPEYHTRAALLGLGGVGKSQIAIEFAYRACKRPPQRRIFWVYASNVVRFKQSYGAIARTARLPAFDDPKTDVLSLVKFWLESEESGIWLLILDNADDVDIFFPTQSGHATTQSDAHPRSTGLSIYLPRSSRGSILITTRSRETAFRLTGKENRLFLVERMNQVDAVVLLRKKLPNDRSEEKNWLALVAALECLPLAITQAAAYVAMNAPWMTVAKYIEHFSRSESAQTSLLSSDGGDLRRDPDVPNAVVKTLQISFEQIQRQNPAAANLLSLMAVFDRHGLPSFLFRKDEDDAILEFDKVIGVLLGFSFLAMHKEDAFIMHPLVQLSVRTWLTIHGEIENAKEHALALLAAKFPSADYSNWKMCEVLEPHVQMVLGHGFSAGWTEDLHASLLFNSGQYSWTRGDFKAAYGRAQRSKDLTESIFGMKDARTLASLSLMGIILSDQGKYDEAEEIHRQVLGLCEIALGKEHPDTLASMNNLATVLRKQGKYDEAEEIHRQVLGLREIALGKEHPDTLASMNNLATVLGNQGKYDKAEEIQRQALRLREIALGKEHPDTLASINNLATVLGDQGKYDEAEEIHRQVLGLCEIALGKEHPDTLASMNNLATVLGNQGKYDKAEEIQRQALRLREIALGKEHPDTLASMNNLATVLRKQGKYDEAEEIHRQVLGLREIALGKEHPDTLASMNNLATVLGNQGKYDKAEEIQRQALRLREISLEKEHPDTLSSVANLAATLWYQGRLDEAAELELRVLDTTVRILGPEHPETCVSMVNLAVTWKSQGRREDAINLLLKAARLQAKVLGSDHPNTNNSVRHVREWAAEIESFEDVSASMQAELQRYLSSVSECQICDSCDQID